MDNHDDRESSEHIYDNLNIPVENLEIGRLIGKGASCHVFQAKLRTLAGVQAVAVKKLLDPKYKTEDEDQGKKIPTEISFLKSLVHRNIIKLIGVVKIPGRSLRIVTELASKGSLYHYLKQKRSDNSRLMKKLFIIWTMDAAYAIQFLQKKNVAHRDIKSLNFVITSGDVLKLCDFGISKNMEATMETAMARGTIRWMAPEVFNDLIFSFASDIYSFGIVVWEILTCNEPFEGKSPYQVMKAVDRNERPEIPQDCPKSIREMVVQCWQTDHMIRPKIDDIVRCLEEEYSEQKVQSLTDIFDSIGNSNHGDISTTESSQPAMDDTHIYVSYNPHKPPVSKTKTQPLYANVNHEVQAMEDIQGANPTVINNPTYAQSGSPELVEWENDSDSSTVDDSDQADIGVTRDKHLLGPDVNPRRQSGSKIGNIYIATRTCFTIDGEVCIEDGEMIEVIDVDPDTGYWYISLQNDEFGYVRPEYFGRCPWMKRRRSSSMSDLRVDVIEDVNGMVRAESGNLCIAIGNNSRTEANVKCKMESKTPIGNTSRRRSTVNHFHRFRQHAAFGLTRCDFCSKVIRGGIKRPIKCQDCGILVHPQCENSVSCCKYRPEL